MENQARDSKEHKPIPFIREPMKGNTEENVLAAEQRFRNYVKFSIRIRNRIEAEKNAKNGINEDQ